MIRSPWNRRPEKGKALVSRVGSWFALWVASRVFAGSFGRSVGRAVERLVLPRHCGMRITSVFLSFTLFHSFPSMRPGIRMRQLHKSTLLQRDSLRSFEGRTLVSWIRLMLTASITRVGPALTQRTSLDRRDVTCLMDTLDADCINHTSRPSSDATHFTRSTGGYGRHASVSWTRLTSTTRIDINHTNRPSSDATHFTGSTDVTSNVGAAAALGSSYCTRLTRFASVAREMEWSVESSLGRSFFSAWPVVSVTLIYRVVIVS
ncbi:hypothetical protein PRIPAC_78639, partial [Pristionchus pacificus]|uniref:Uncharacterized protein n=1 Tax=Pristionchus pacificus TaxID=54126 RepID=A0A2A6C2Z0_PRIPA